VRMREHQVVVARVSALAMQLVERVGDPHRQWDARLERFDFGVPNSPRT
jgi:hypothetical protein